MSPGLTCYNEPNVCNTNIVFFCKLSPNTVSLSLLFGIRAAASYFCNNGFGQLSGRLSRTPHKPFGMKFGMVLISTFRALANKVSVLNPLCLPSFSNHVRHVVSPATWEKVSWVNACPIVAFVKRPRFLFRQNAAVQKVRKFSRSNTITFYHYSPMARQFALLASSPQPAPIQPGGFVHRFPEACNVFWAWVDGLNRQVHVGYFLKAAHPAQ